MNGIFTLGKNAIDDMLKLDELKKRKNLRQSELNNKKSTLDKKEKEHLKYTKDFKDTIWNILLKQNEADFKEAFKGYRRDKEKFCDEVIRRYKINHSSPYTKENLKKRTLTLFSSKPETCPVIELDLDNILKEMNDIENNPIWEKNIIGNQDVPIAKLINTLDNTDWVKNGRIYIKGNICPFCQQETINDNLKLQLEQFFGGEYDKDINNMFSLKESYKYNSDILLEKLNKITENNYYFNISEIEKSKLTSLISLAETAINKNIAEIESKISEPSKKLKINLINISEIKMLIETGNKLVSKHNQMVANFNSQRSTLINDIWTFLLDEQEALISGYLLDVNKFEKAINGISKSIQSLNNEILHLEREIVEVNKNMTSVQPAVNEINRLLKAYGFNNFQIVPSPDKENSYQIQRPDGSLARNTLSEGEETFISFLYFLQLTKGATDISKISTEKILIIDDPICSLDSTILYIVSTLVKGLIYDIKHDCSDVKQLFIFTHNVFFHKEVSFFNRQSDKCIDMSYWIIHKNETNSSIHSYEHKNPIHTSYELLWREIRESEVLSFITVQNTMRRIVENYFGMLGNSKYDNIKKEFPTVEEQQICESLFYWINDGSHSIPDDLYVDSYSDSIDKYKKVFHEVFIISGHEAHYNMMMGISSNNLRDEKEAVLTG